MAAKERPAWASALKELRQRNGLSQEDLAAKVDVDRTTVSRWETGRNRPQPQQLRRLCSEFAVSLRGLGFVESDSEDELERRRLVKGLVGIGLVGSLLDPEHLAAALDAPRSVDHRVLDDLEFQGHQFGQLYWQLSPASFWPTLYGYTVVTRQVQRTASGGLAVQAGVIASRATTLLGMLAHRLHRRADAVASFRMADELADEAGDGPQRAHALVALRAVYSPVTGGDVRTDASKALALLDEADHAAGPAAPPVLRTWLYACRAEDYSLLSQPANAARDLEAAEQSLARVSGRLDGFFHHWDAPRLAGFRGNCHVLLRQPDEAIAVLEPVVHDTSPNLIGPYTAVRCDLAAAWSQRGDVERTCQLLSEVLVMARQVNAPERADRVRRIRERRLAQWPDAPTVRQLDAQLQDFVTEE
jgi:transcriptional regulator with XRE-family HTH domain